MLHFLVDCGRSHITIVIALHCNSIGSENCGESGVYGLEVIRTTELSPNVNDK